MVCETCGEKMVERQATRDAPYAYKLCGLKGIFLAGIKVRVCKCGESPIIPKIGQLHGVIADALLRKPNLLLGPELRFLRKNAGMPANKFATLLDITPDYLSKVENGHLASLGGPTDRLARAITMVANSEGVRDLLLELAEVLGKKKADKVQTFTLNNDRWAKAA
jgi:transcriptional regulator with XRE-family HTH domain